MSVPVVDEKSSLPQGRHLPWLLEALVTLIRTKPLGVFSGIVVIILLLTALFAPLLAPYPFDEMVGRRLLKPSGKFLLGTDYIGRDLLSRIIFGARVSVLIGFGTIAVGTTGATIIGVTSGYFGGKFDTIVQRAVDVVMAFPWLILVISIIAIIGVGRLNLILTIGFLMMAGNSRIIRSAVFAIKENQYIEAAEAMGASTSRVILLHVLPNVVAPIIVIATANIGAVIIIEASLSFLGMGVPPPNPTWGSMLSSQSGLYFERAPWLVIFPGVALALTVFSMNMFGDAVRDVLDPRLKAD